MIIADNIIKEKLKNVFFIWGSGKTTIANALNKKYGIYVYHTDDRDKHFKIAKPEFQIAMCRNVSDFWSLDPEDALSWEIDLVREFTPMIICDLMQLSNQYEKIICEGDIDINGIINVVTNAVTISNYGKSQDFFDRPDQRHMLEEIKNRDHLTEKEKDKIIQNAYKIVGPIDNEIKKEIPIETKLYGIKQIIRDNSTTIEDTLREIEIYFNFIV